MTILKSLLSQYSSSLLVPVLLSLCVTSSLLAQVPGVEPIIEIDKKIVTYDEAGQEVEADDLGEVLVGTPIFFRYLVSYTGYITSTGTVTVTVPITDTIPVGVGIDLLTIRDDMGTLTPDDDFACVRTTAVITGTIPVASTFSITTTLPITNTVIFTDTTPLIPGDGFECVSSSGVISDTQAVFTPRSGGGYLNIADVVAGPCAGGCESDASDQATYVGLYWAFTPGFWKNHTGEGRARGRDAWAYTGYDPDMLLSNVFPDAAADYTGGETTLLEALGFKGGKGTDGAAKILLRAGVAALLNASFHETMNNYVWDDNDELMLPDGRTLFPYSSQAIVEWIEGLLASPPEDRKTILLVAKELDDVNDGIHYIQWD